MDSPLYDRLMQGELCVQQMCPLPHFDTTISGLAMKEGCTILQTSPIPRWSVR